MKNMPGIIILLPCLCGAGCMPTSFSAAPQALQPENIAAQWDAYSGSTAGAQRIEAQVAARMQSEPSLEDAAIRVTVMEGGVTVLGGTLQSETQRAAAVNIARSCPGVTKIIDRLTLTTGK